MIEDLLLLAAKVQHNQISKIFNYKINLYNFLNRELLRKDGSYKPAYMLENEELERYGRTTKKTNVIFSLMLII